MRLDAIPWRRRALNIIASPGNGDDGRGRRRAASVLTVYRDRSWTHRRHGVGNSSRWWRRRWTLRLLWMYRRRNRAAFAEADDAANTRVARIVPCKIVPSARGKVVAAKRGALGDVTNVVGSVENDDAPKDDDGAETTANARVETRQARRRGRTRRSARGVGGV